MFWFRKKQKEILETPEEEFQYKQSITSEEIPDYTDPSRAGVYKVGEGKYMTEDEYSSMLIDNLAQRMREEDKLKQNR